jgi:integrase/recombinase XerD
MAILATTGIFLDKYHPQKDGKCAVSIRITYLRKKRYYPTPFRLSADEFEKMRTAERPREEIKRMRLQLGLLEQKAGKIIENMPYFTWEAFEKQFLTNRGHRNQIKAAFDAYIIQLKEQDRIGTAVSYECARNSLAGFKADIVFAEVTPTLLHKYEKWMLDGGKSKTTVGIYLRSLRTIFNNAIADGLITKELYPFGKRKYEIPTGKNTKKALPHTDIKLIYNFPAKQGTTLDMAKDYWLFIYFCNGLNVKDMCLLKYKNIQGDMLVFERAKTERSKRQAESIRVPLIEEVKMIISKWGNEHLSRDTFIFPVLSPGLSAERQRQLIQQLTHVINDHLKTIAKALSLDSNLTTYTARHSFATVLKRNGYSVEAIREALGHSSGRTTQNYLASFEDESKQEMAKALTAFKHIRQESKNECV